MGIETNIRNYIKIWESRGYSDGIPDEAPSRLENLGKVPSYKMIVRAILKNDNTLKTLGLPQKKSEVYSYLKKIEIENRNKS